MVVLDEWGTPLGILLRMAEKRPQTLENHAKFDPPFHLFAVPVAALNVMCSVYRLIRDPNLDTGWGALMALGLVVAVFLIRIYPLKVQDRVIRLEEQMRMQILLPAALRARAFELSEKQVVALRFASDGELPSLVEQTLNQKLEPKDIKKQIKVWRPDYFRV